MSLAESMSCALTPAALGDFHKTVGIRAVRRTNDENQIYVLGDLFDGFLAILCGVADVVTCGALYCRESLAKAGDNFLGIVQTECRLREERKLVGLGDFQGVHGGDGIHDDGAVRGFAGSAHDFLVVAVADQNDGALFAGEFEGF